MLFSYLVMDVRDFVFETTGFMLAAALALPFAGDTRPGSVATLISCGLVALIVHAGIEAAFASPRPRTVASE